VGPAPLGGPAARCIPAHLKLRNEEAKTRVLAITGELTDLAEASVAEATRVLVNARRHLARRGAGASGGLRSTVAELDTLLGRATRVIEQTVGVLPHMTLRVRPDM
jgi:hypothetical protein